MPLRSTVSLQKLIPLSVPAYCEASKAQVEGAPGTRIGCDFGCRHLSGVARRSSAEVRDCWYRNTRKSRCCAKHTEAGCSKISLRKNSPESSVGNGCDFRDEVFGLNSKLPVVSSREAGLRSAMPEIHLPEPTHSCIRVPEAFAPDWRLSVRSVMYSTPPQACF